MSDKDEKTATETTRETTADEAAGAPVADETGAANTEGGTDDENTPAAATEPNAGDADPARVMYIGPNRLREGLQRYQVFKGLPTQRIEGMKEKYPHIARLFVDVEKLGAAMEAVERKGTPLFIAYNEILGVEE